MSSITIDAGLLGNITEQSITDKSISNMYSRSNIVCDMNGCYSTVENITTAPKLIKRIGNKTFVTWNDGTETKVKCEYGKPFDPFSAFCIAFTKHVLGSTTKILEAIESADETVLKQKEAEAKRLWKKKRKNSRRTLKRSGMNWLFCVRRSKCLLRAVNSNVFG